MNIEHDVKSIGLAQSTIDKNQFLSINPLLNTALAARRDVFMHSKSDRKKTGVLISRN